MTTDVYDNEIMQYLPLLVNEEKISLLQTIKTFLNISNEVKNSIKSNGNLSAIDYSKYKFPISKMKIDRIEINER